MNSMVPLTILQGSHGIGEQGIWMSGFLDRENIGNLATNTGKKIENTGKKLTC